MKRLMVTLIALLATTAVVSGGEKHKRHVASE